MTRKWPLIPTIVVLVAAAIMVRLGVWQLEKMEAKEASIQRYEAARALSSAVPWPTNPEEVDAALYRHSDLNCIEVVSTRETAGRSASGQAGWAHIARCRLPEGGEAEVAYGWSSDPASPQWSGGPVAGFVAPAGEGARLIATPGQAGLAQLAAPDPIENSKPTPMGHLAYAFQWFFFALTALAIYWLALKRKWRDAR